MKALLITAAGQASLTELDKPQVGNPLCYFLGPARPDEATPVSFFHCSNFSSIISRGLARTYAAGQDSAAQPAKREAEEERDGQKPEARAPD